MVIYLSDLYLSTTKQIGLSCSTTPLSLLWLFHLLPAVSFSSQHPFTPLSVSSSRFGSRFMRCHVKMTDGVYHGGYGSGLGSVCVEGLYVCACLVWELLPCCSALLPPLEVNVTGCWSMTGWRPLCTCVFVCVCVCTCVYSCPTLDINSTDFSTTYISTKIPNAWVCVWYILAKANAFLLCWCVYA